MSTNLREITVILEAHDQHQKKKMANYMRHHDYIRRARQMRHTEVIQRPQMIDSNDPFLKWTDLEFIKRFRLSKSSTLNLLHTIKEDLEFDTNRNNPIPSHIRLLTALRFFATGNFQRTDADLMSMNQSTACRIIHSVSQAIAKRRSTFIQFPTTQEELVNEQVNFFSENNFPSIIGLIDCTHIKILSPGGEQAEVYRNRKGVFSVNVQIVCNHKLEFTNIAARWPGSTHDSRIFTSSTLSNVMATRGGILLGDSGFPCLQYLMTPVTNPMTQAERRYNRAHILTRIKIERSFGIWKQRFRCLSIPLRTRLDNTLVIIVACACLHNLAISMPLPDTDNDIQTADIATDTGNGAISVGGRIMRQQIINNHFS